ncbi:hypothetical protein PY254_10975 [Rhodanobacter sp. AS-Z3]|uniref:hypothetical protein n=1 Tax=Rhodanobacter sp. AS-Z3 TaxID=3031330 RepID=UPI002479FD72|nr:hypothetical protein [Rhodanobacter sp. AS-Z3]WEN13767.1 hypothetical protein PY254_10975 [Rhodanobacter sp. AS-Z3]
MIEGQLTQWARAAITNFPLDWDWTWEVNPVGVRDGRRLVPRSWSAVLLPILASHTKFPLDARLLCPAPTQLQRIDPRRFGPVQPGLSTVEVEQTVGEVEQEVRQYLGPHLQCYEDARFMLSSIHFFDDTIPWLDEFCVQAWAYRIWRARCLHLVNDCKYFLKPYVGLATQLARDSLRQDLLSSFHYGLQIQVMSRSMVARGTKPSHEGLVSFSDTWTWLTHSPARRGFVYGPADMADLKDCDHGRVAGSWESPMKKLREKQREEAMSDVAVTSPFGSA